MAAFPYNTAQSEGGVVSTTVRDSWGYSRTTKPRLIWPLSTTPWMALLNDSRPHPKNEHTNVNHRLYRGDSRSEVVTPQ